MIRQLTLATVLIAAGGNSSTAQTKKVWLDTSHLDATSPCAKVAEKIVRDEGFVLDRDGIELEFIDFTLAGYDYPYDEVQSTIFIDNLFYSPEHIGKFLFSRVYWDMISYAWGGGDDTTRGYAPVGIIYGGMKHFVSSDRPITHPRDLDDWPSPNDIKIDDWNSNWHFRLSSENSKIGTNVIRLVSLSDFVQNYNGKSGYSVWADIGPENIYVNTTMTIMIPIYIQVDTILVKEIDRELQNLVDSIVRGCSSAVLKEERRLVTELENLGIAVVSADRGAFRSVSRSIIADYAEGGEPDAEFREKLRRQIKWFDQIGSLADK